MAGIRKLLLGSKETSPSGAQSLQLPQSQGTLFAANIFLGGGEEVTIP